MIKILGRTGPRGCHIVMLDITAMSIYTDDLDLGRYDWDCASARRDLWVYDMALTLRRVGEHLSIYILLIFFEPKGWRKPTSKMPSANISTALITVSLDVDKETSTWGWGGENDNDFHTKYLFQLL